MTYQLQIKENQFSYSIGYFDPKMSDKPADRAFRVVFTASKSDVTEQGAIAIAKDIAYTDERYKY